MKDMTLAEFVEVLRACAGDSDEYDIDGDIRDIPFEDLGYDSLALLEVFARLKQEHGVELSEEEVADLTTPGAALEAINRVRAQKVA